MQKKYQNKLYFLVTALLVANIALLLNQDKGYYFDAQHDLYTSILNTRNVVALTNGVRKDADLQKLKISKKLSAAAQLKADDMLKNTYFSHESPGGKTPWNFLGAAGYEYVFAGENLAINFSSAEDVVNAWIKSPDHKENILNPLYTEIGIGIASGTLLNTPVTIVVQMFGRPLKENYPSSAVAIPK